MFGKGTNSNPKHRELGEDRLRGWTAGGWVTDLWIEGVIWSGSLRVEACSRTQVWEKVGSPSGRWGRISPIQGNQVFTHCLPEFFFLSLSLTFNRLLQPQGFCICCPLWLEHPFLRSLSAGSVWSNANAIASWRLPLPTHHIWTLYSIVLHGFIQYNLKSSCSPLEWETLRMGTLCVSPGPRPTSDILSWRNECALFTPGYFSQDIVWHSRKTAYKNLNPVRKQKDLFGKMKQNIFLSCINIWWMLTRYFQNKKHIETAYVSGQMKL